MRARDVVGRRIVGIENQRARATSGRGFLHLNSILLDNGTKLVLTTVEVEDEAAGIEAIVLRPKQRRGHMCPTVIFPFVGEVGHCVDCGKAWTRAELRKRDEEAR